MNTFVCHACILPRTHCFILAARTAESFVARKVANYLNWLNIPTRVRDVCVCVCVWKIQPSLPSPFLSASHPHTAQVFNLGDYRRERVSRQVSTGYFDPSNNEAAKVGCTGARAACLCLSTVV